MAVEFVTPVGRLVQGDLYKLNDKNNKGEAYIVKTGVNKGQPTKRGFFAVAVEKTNPDWGAFWGTIYQEGRTGYPQFFDAAGNCLKPNFSWKVIDGDGVDEDGKPNKDKEGFAGCWVIRFSGSFAPKVVHNGELVNIEGYVKRGYYVRVAGNAAANIGSDKAGLYMNAAAVELIAYGKEIVGGIDAVGVFGAAARPTVLPAGASATPLAGSPGLPNVGQGAMPAATPPQMPAMGGTPGLPPMGQPAAPAMPGMGAPNHQFVQNALGQPPQQMAAPGMPAMGIPQMPTMQPPVIAALKPTPAAQGYTLEQWKAQGYTEDQLIAGQIFTR